MLGERKKGIGKNDWERKQSGENKKKVLGRERKVIGRERKVIGSDWVKKSDLVKKKVIG